jgi:hypothetical protein
MSSAQPSVGSKPAPSVRADAGEVGPPTRVPVSSTPLLTNTPQNSNGQQQEQQQEQQQYRPRFQPPESAPHHPTSTVTLEELRMKEKTSSSSGDDAASDPSLATSSRSKYRTYILSNGVFEVEQRYEIREVIGQGAYGVVCSALDHKTNSFVAVKKIENILDHRSLAKRTLRELKLVRAFQHENILGLERVMRPHSSTFNNIYLVSELMETDLACVIRSPQELTDEHCQFFIYQCLRGLKYIHSAKVIHRDLKPRNLLVNSNCE